MFSHHHVIFNAKCVPNFPITISPVKKVDVCLRSDHDLSWLQVIKGHNDTN